MARPLVITVIGKSARDPNDPVPPEALAAAEEVGKLLAERGAVVVSGGLSGVMDAVSTTWMGWMRNTLTVRAADAVIMISGGIGTLNELTFAYEDKPTVILEGTGGWSDRIPEIAYDGKHLDEAHRGTLHYARSPQDAVDLALQLARSATGGDGRKEYQS